MPEDRPWRGFKTVKTAESDLLIMGIPFDGAVSSARGAAEAPSRLRRLSVNTPPVSEEGLDLRRLVISDRGDATLNPEEGNYFNKVAAEALGLFKTGKFSLFLGGDHSVTIPLGKAFTDCYKPKQVGMIHLDAHCDLMDSYQGNRWSHACPQRRFLEHDNVFSNNLALVGIRNYEVEEIEFLRKNPSITVINSRQFYLRPHQDIQHQVIKAMQGLDAVYLSLDIDVLDPAYAPGTGVPEAGGLTTREVIEFVRGIMLNLPVKAMDLVEVAPPLDHSDITSWSAIRIVYETFAALALSQE
ncbi:MAG: agmatinase [Bacillota bacterium]